MIFDVVLETTVIADTPQQAAREAKAAMIDLLAADQAVIGVSNEGPVAWTVDLEDGSTAQYPKT